MKIEASQFGSEKECFGEMCLQSGAYEAFRQALVMAEQAPTREDVVQSLRMAVAASQSDLQDVAVILKEKFGGQWGRT